MDRSIIGRMGPVGFSGILCIWWMDVGVIEGCFGFSGFPGMLEDSAGFSKIICDRLREIT